MKKLMIVVAVLGISTMSFAQPKEIITSEEKALLATDKMKTEGLITEEEFDEVFEINLKSAEKKKQIHAEMKTKMEEFRAQIKQVESQRMEAYEEVLSEEQVRNIKIAKAKRKAHLMKRRKSHIKRPHSQFNQMVPRSRPTRPQE